MSSDDSDVTRRDFIKQSAVFAAASAAWYSTAMKTDALGQPPPPPGGAGLQGGDNTDPYMYNEP